MFATRPDFCGCEAGVYCEELHYLLPEHILRIFLDFTKGEAAESLGMYGESPDGVLGLVPLLGLIS